MATGYANRHAIRANRAIRSVYRNDKQRLVVEDVQDILADILHLCDYHEWDFEELMFYARNYHEEDKRRSFVANYHKQARG